MGIYTLTIRCFLREPEVGVQKGPVSRGLPNTTTLGGPLV